MTLVKTFTTYLAVFWSTLIVLKLFAQLLFSFLNIRIESRFYRLGCELLCGIIFMVLLYPIAVTHFHSLFIGLLIPMGLAVWLFNIRKVQNPFNRIAFTSDTWKDIVVLLAIASPLYLWEFYQLFDVPTMGFKTTFIDYYYYACMSNSFNHYQVENDFGIANQIVPALVSGTSPYHYAEIWINAGLTRFFGVPAMLSLMFVCYPLFDTVVVIALLSTWEVFGPVNFIGIALSYLLILMNGVSWGLMDKIAVPSSYCYVHLTPMGEFAKKLTPVYAIVAGAGMFYFRGKPLLMLFCFSLISFFYTPLFGATLFAVLVVAAFMFYKKDINSRSLAAVALLVFGTGIFLFVYFILNRCEFKAESFKAFHPHLTELFKNPKNIAIYKDIILLTIMISLKVILSMTPYLPVVIIYIAFVIKKAIKPTYMWWLLVFVFLAASNATASLMNPMPDSIQLFANGLPAFVLVLAFAFISLVSSLSHSQTSEQRTVYHKYGYLTIFFYLAVVLSTTFYHQFWHQNYEKYSAEYISQCKSRLLNAHEAGLVTFLRTKEDFNGEPFDWMWKNTPGILAFYYGNPTDYTVLNLQDAEFYRAPDTMQLYRLKQQPVYLYDKYKLNHEHPGDSSVTASFVRDYQVKFIFSRGQPLPGSLYPLLIDSVSDKVSGEVCYELK